MEENKQTLFENIELYLSGQLTGDELTAFEKAIKNDPDLSAEIELHRLMSTAIADKEKDDSVKQALETAGKAYLERENKGVKKNGKIRAINLTNWAVAASFALLIALAAWFYWTNTGSMSGSELFAYAFEAPSLTDRQRSSSEEINAVIESAYSNYESGAFEKAVIDFEIALQSVDRASLKYYQAVSSLASSPPDTQKAKDLFESIINEGNSAFADASKWFLALTYLKTEDKESARPLLIELTEKPSKYKERAMALVKKL